MEVQHLIIHFLPAITMFCMGVNEVLEQHKNKISSKWDGQTKPHLHDLQNTGHNWELPGFGQLIYLSDLNEIHWFGLLFVYL